MASVPRLSVWPFVAGICAFQSAQGAELYVGVGAGTVFTQGPAVQVAAAVYGAVELHYMGWRESGERNRAFGIGYRFRNEGRLSVVLGAAYVHAVDDNLLRHPNAYVEVRYNVFKNFSCQASHYSGPGPDRGDNMFLCGMQWRR